jgi:ribosomal protein L19
MGIFMSKKKKKNKSIGLKSPTKINLATKVTLEIENINSRIIEINDKVSNFKSSLCVTKFNIQQRNGDPGKNVNVQQSERIVERYNDFLGDFLKTYESVLVPIKNKIYTEESYLALVDLSETMEKNYTLLSKRIKEVTKVKNNTLVSGKW